MRKRCRKSGRACARLEGWGGGNPSCFETHRSAAEAVTAAVLTRCDAPQHEGGRRRWHFGRTKPSGGRYQPAAVGNERRRDAIVSGLLLTMNGATPTCRAVGAVRRPSASRASPFIFSCYLQERRAAFGGAVADALSAREAP